MKQKYCLKSIDSFEAINQNPTNRSSTKQLYSFSKSPRFNTIQANCPSNSYLKSQSPSGSGGVIGTAKKKNFTELVPTSPGSKYKISTLFDNNKSKKKGYSLGLNREKIAINSYINPQNIKIPGVGRYHLQTETSVSRRKEPAYTLRGRTRILDRTMTIEPQNDNPSPAAYENNPEKSSSLFSSSFKRLSYSGSKSKRFINPDNKIPGPANYNNHTPLSNIGRYVISTHKGGTWGKFDTARRVTKFDETERKAKALPGPGSYRQSSEFGQYDGNVYQKSSSRRLLR